MHGGPLRPRPDRRIYDRWVRGSVRGAASLVALLGCLVGLLSACDGTTATSPEGRGPSGPSTSTSPPTGPPAATATQAATPDGNGDTVPPLPDLTRSPTVPVPTAGRSATPAGRTFGADSSWPQCPKGMGIPQKRTEGRPMPTSAARFVVLGLTNGVSFVANPCLADQVQWVKDRHLLAAAYAVVSYPDATTLQQQRERGPFPAGTRLGGLRNVGYRAALFNLDTMRRTGLQSPVVWIDVEPVTGFDWSADVTANAAVVQGMERGYRDGGVRIGYYSIGSLWTRVVGPLRTGAPEWRPAGARGLGEALRRCGADWSFGGGRGVIGQWIEDGRDRDVTCPGAVPDLRSWFHQY